MMRVALIHDWLTWMRGGERVLEALLQLFPDAEIYTLVHAPGSVSAEIEGRRIRTSLLDRLPAAHRHFRYLLPLFPRAIESLRLRDVELVVSSSACVAKGVRPPPGVPHLCYCHTPMRYVWDLYEEYFGPGRAPLPVRAVAPWAARRLRRWDRASAERVSAFVANSRTVQERIRRCYGREAEVVYPPVALERFHASEPRDDFYLVVSALVPYKRIDLAVEAFNRLGRRLLIVGDGPELARLRSRARGNVEFLGRLSDEEIAGLMGRCRALLFPGLEDFGIVPVEAQAAGAPVIAYGEGGVRETVFDARRRHPRWPHGPTGLFFDEQTPEALLAAVEEFESLAFDPAALRASAARFTLDVFHRGIRDAVERLMADAAAAQPPVERGAYATST